MTEPLQREARSTAYDVVVVGGGMGGLTAGALLARSGKKVVVIDDQESPGGHAHAFRADGYTFDSADHLITRCGQSPLLGTGLVDELLRHLGVRDRCELLPVRDPFFTVQYPDFRMAVPTGREAYIAAHAQHFPEEAHRLRWLVDLSTQVARELEELAENPGLRDLALSRWRTPTLFRYRNATMQQIVDRELRDPRLKAVYSALWSWVGSPPSKGSFLVWAAMMGQYIEDGAYYCRGGFQSLADAVGEALTRAGGELVLATKVTKILVKDRRASGVVLATGQQINAPLVISNIDPRATFQQLVGEREAPARMVRKLDRLELSIPCLAAYVATDLDVRSLGVTHETLYGTMWDLDQTVSAALGGEVPGISVTVPTLTDPSLAPPGQHIVIIMAVAPTVVKAADADLGERVMQLAEHVLPGLRDHLTVNLGAPGSRQVPVRRIESIYGAAITPRQVGYWRLPHRTPIKGLLLVGQWTRPGHGVPWVMESGVQVARAILGRSAAAEKMPHGLIPIHA